MNWNEHSKLKGNHAFLSPSKHSWLNYDDEKMKTTILNADAQKRGTELHAFAEQAIRLKQNLPKTQKTLNLYVNDAIRMNMDPEVVLYFSDNCFGTADTISFDGHMLRIHDLKTGKTEASIEQLMIYAALFCLEYNKDPASIEIELRIYQSNEVICVVPDPNDISEIMRLIIHFDEVIESTKGESA